MVPTLSIETLRRILHEGKVTWKRTTTWKSSNDPDFITKMHRILALYDTPPDDGRVVCVDEFGPLNLMPRKGKAWGPVRSPRRLRATYNRYNGVMHVLAALDLATGEIYYRIRRRKRWREFLGLLKALRARWPGEKLYVVLDNFSPHKHPNVRAWAAAHDIELVVLPTYGSWLNWIESEFAAIAAYVRRRNARTGPKTRFAPDSPIREWTEYPTAA